MPSCLPSFWMHKTISFKINSFLVDVFVTQRCAHTFFLLVLLNRLSVWAFVRRIETNVHYINTSIIVLLGAWIFFSIFFSLCNAKIGTIGMCLSCSVYLHALYTNPGSQFPLVKIFVCLCPFFLLDTFYGSCRTKSNVYMLYCRGVT